MWTDGVEIKVVPGQPCPKCKGRWGHADPHLDFPNRPKVADEDGIWWWRCYNPACSVHFFEPSTGVFD
jgi:hypothetical protein